MHQISTTWPCLNLFICSLILVVLLILLKCGNLSDQAAKQNSNCIWLNLNLHENEPYWFLWISNMLRNTQEWTLLVLAHFLQILSFKYNGIFHNIGKTVKLVIIRLSAQDTNSTAACSKGCTGLCTSYTVVCKLLIQTNQWSVLHRASPSVSVITPSMLPSHLLRVASASLIIIHIFPQNTSSAFVIISVRTV